MKLFEVDNSKRQDEVAKFVKFVVDELGIENPPPITIDDDKDVVKKNGSMGYTIPGEGIWVYFGERFLPDFLRTLAHELVHWRQHEEDRLKPDSGKTGSEEENEANSKAGVLLRDYGKKRPQIFENRRMRIRQLLELGPPRDVPDLTDCESITAAEKMLTDAGWKRYANGAFGVVYTQPWSEWVVKLARWDECWFKWAEACKDNGNPHLPEIHSCGENGFHWGVIEMLRPIHVARLPFDFERMMGKYIARKKIETRNKRNGIETEFEPDEDLNEWIEDNLSFAEALDVAIEFMTDSGCTVDLHSGNIMQRNDGTLVITDPGA